MASILIADDDESLRRIIRCVLEGQGHRIIEAETGVETIEQFYKSAPDIILLDVDIGDDMSGFEVCRKIREDPYGVSVPVIFLTAMTSEENLIQGFQEGADDYIRKPVTIAELIARVSSHITRLKRQSKRISLLGDRQFAVGNIIEGKEAKYKITERLSDGGMGVIFRGYRLTDNFQVVIKTLKSSFLENFQDVRRFLQEADATIQVDHPNLAQGLEVVRTADYCFFVMKFIKGDTLEDIVEDQGRITPNETLEIVKQMASGLEHLSKLHLVHRDVKPANIIITPQKQAVLVDMGLVKNHNSTTNVTEKGVVLGTPTYIAPEQVLGGNVDIRSDIYSLGITFYYALTGDIPFPGQSTTAIISVKLAKTFSLPEETEVPQQFAKILEKMLKHSPQERYQTPQELLNNLKQLPITANKE